MRKFYLFVFALTIIIGCTISKKFPETIQNDEIKKEDISRYEPTEYLSAPTRSIDIIHTKLEVNFDWKKQYLFGKATLTLKPYFYSTKEIILDAKGFEIKNVSANHSLSLPFIYDKTQLTITLDKEYTRNDTLSIFIDYIAKPNERKIKTGNTITSDKGLYFINPSPSANGKEKNKPTELWTQGEPESNSCWFPTIDKPNERMTQEIFITLDSAHSNFVTLSNGLLISSTKNMDGSRTDYWKQNLPAAPYLSMIAIGDYAIVKDKWRNIDVNYYAEKEYEPYTKNIFGHTPEMMEFFSTKLGVNYPWEKFSQVVVRGFVSGAMENTGAVVYGEFMNQTNRELLDNNYEDVIAHELFHHWFGNYVTCESWSNTSLNEGFATYSEYLWNEYKYGRDAADQHGYESMINYFSSTSHTPKNLIRFSYNDPDDMFDSHSYNKGGAIIHMLRKYIGDDAFFTSLKLYLEKHKFSSVEAHDLRLTFEQVTGEDLNWFFNQWFFSSGYPNLLIQHQYNDTIGKYFVQIKQTQDLSKFPMFKLPIDIDIYMNGKKERKHVWVKNEIEKFAFDVSQKPDFVNVDAEKMLLCMKEEKLSVEERFFQYKNCPLYLDRLEAIKELSVFASIPEAADVIISALNDRNADLRTTAIAYLEKLPAEYKSVGKKNLIQLATDDKKPSVRASAIDYLTNNFSDDNLNSLYRNAVKDSSSLVATSALYALAKKDEKEVMKIVKQFETDKSMSMRLAVAQIYSLYGNDENQTFFVKLSKEMSGWNNISFAMTYTNFLKHCSDSTINSGAIILENIAHIKDNKWVCYFGQKGLKDLAQMYADREEETLEKISELKKKSSSAITELSNLKEELTYIQSQKQKLTMMLYNSVVETN
ncbi:MAG: M1 family aminopeptidase [Bacteroidota bacterium]